MSRPRLLIHTAAAAVLLAMVGQSARAQDGPRLVVAAESSSLCWNGVAVSGRRVFVSGPRALQPPGSSVPSVAEVGPNGALVPYPDAAWNAWKAGDAPTRAFVNVNAIHLDGRGGLWAIDSGTPDFGGQALPGAAKAVRMDLATGRVDRVYAFPSDVATPASYVNDIRFHGQLAYLTDSGRPGIIVLDLRTGAAWRALDQAPSARGNRPIVVAGRVLRGSDDRPLLVNTDPLETSPDGRWLYYGPAGGPWSAVETRWLDDPVLAAQEAARHVVPWADLPPTGGTAMDREGNLYFSDLDHLGVNRRSADGRISIVIRDPRLHWVDAPAIDGAGDLWLPVPQIDRAAAFNHGLSQVRWPIQLFRLQLTAAAGPDSSRVPAR